MSDNQMTKDDAIEQSCSIIALAYHSLGDYTTASDGFCRRCDDIPRLEYRNEGLAIEFVRLAVVEALNARGIKVDRGFDPITGVERRALAQATSLVPSPDTGQRA